MSINAKHMLFVKHGFKSKQEFDEYLEYQYNSSGLSVKKIADKLCETELAIRRYFNRNKFKTRTVSEAMGLLVEDIKLTARELSIIIGCLLGDGSLRTKKYTAFLRYSCKHKSVLKSLMSELPRLNWMGPYKRIKIINGKSQIHWNIDSNSFKSLLNLRHKWYQDGQKIVPRDLILNQLIGYWWHLGDGSQSTGITTLCTNGFTTSDVEFLISILPIISKLGYNKRKYPVINIFNQLDRLNWLEFIGPCKNQSYNYRWIIRDSSNQIITTPSELSMSIRSKRLLEKTNAII